VSATTKETKMNNVNKKEETKKENKNLKTVDEVLNSISDMLIVMQTIKDLEG
jgi:serine/threonine-protein kinase RIO1